MYDYDKYFEEIEGLHMGKWDGHWKRYETELNHFTLNLMGRCAYEALYMFAREKGFTKEQATEICASKWPRHNEERLTEIFYKALDWSLPQTIEKDMINYTEDEQA